MSDLLSKSELIMSLRDYQFEKLTSVGFDREYDLMGKIIKGIENHPTLDEKEIIRKTVERVVERLERELESANNELKRTIERNPMQTDFALGYKMAIKNAIKIAKKECGLNE